MLSLTFGAKFFCMKKIYLVSLFFGLMQQAFPQTISLTNLATPYQQDFNTLANTGTTNANTTLPTGWLMSETGNNANTTYAADSGTANSGNTYSFGSAASTERAFGGLLSGSLVPTIGAGFTNNTGAVITSIAFTYTGEQWRLGAANRLDKLDFQYSLDASDLTTGTYINVDALDFTAPVTAGTLGALDGNATANKTLVTFTINGLSIAAGSTFYIKWNDFNPSGNDDGLSIDDLTMNFNGVVLPACSIPTAQPGIISFSSVTTASISLSFVAATPAPDQYLTVISTSPFVGNPINGTTYSVDDPIGNGIVENVGTNLSFTSTGLNAGTLYYYTIFSVSSNCTGGPLYKTDVFAAGNQSTNAPPVCITPVAQISNVIFTTISNSSLGGSFTAATDADSYLICYSTNSTLGFTPVNGSTYTVGQTVGNGKVTKAGPGTTFSQSGLLANTTYYFSIFPFNNAGCTGGPLYNTTAFAATQATNNSSTGIPTGYYDAILSTDTCRLIKTKLKTRTTTGMTPRSYGELPAQYYISDKKTSEIRSGAPEVIWDIYSDKPGASDPYDYLLQPDDCTGSAEAGGWNREHSVPQSWFTGGTATGPGTDYFHIYPTDCVVNAWRSSWIYSEVSSPTITTLNGSKVGPSAFAGLTGTTFEPINEFKGDLARAFLYFVTRYEDQMPGWTGGTNGTQAMNPTTFPSVDLPYLSLMLKWHNQDPVSQKEIDRNNAGYTYQGNRNPYVDHPEYVNMVWNTTLCYQLTSITPLPVDIISFKGYLKGDKVQLEWDVTNEQNLLAYEVERSINGRDFTKIGTVNATNASTYNYADDINHISGRRLYYRLKKADKDGKNKYTAMVTVHVPLNLQFTVYPNPVVDEYVRVQFTKPTARNASVQVTDMAGRNYMQLPVATGTTSLLINLQKVPAGMYLIKLVQDGNTVVQKIQVL